MIAVYDHVCEYHRKLSESLLVADYSNKTPCELSHVYLTRDREGKAIPMNTQHGATTRINLPVTLVRSIAFDPSLQLSKCISFFTLSSSCLHGLFAK